MHEARLLVIDCRSCIAINHLMPLSVRDAVVPQESPVVKTRRAIAVVTVSIVLMVLMAVIDIGFSIALAL